MHCIQRTYIERVQILFIFLSHCTCHIPQHAAVTWNIYLNKQRTNILSPPTQRDIWIQSYITKVRAFALKENITTKRTIALLGPGTGGGFCFQMDRHISHSTCSVQGELHRLLILLHYEHLCFYYVLKIHYFYTKWISYYFNTCLIVICFAVS